mgnify:CR=1 FL=1
MIRADLLEQVLSAEYDLNINIVNITPLHDELFDDCYVVCIGNVIVCRADLSLKDICEAIEKMQSKEAEHVRNI